MRLRELDAEFVGRVTAEGYHRQGMDSVGAQGVLFQCPVCGVGKPRAPDGGIEGDHYILVLFQGTPTGLTWMNDPRWTTNGAGLDGLTLSPSVDCTKGDACRFHGWVKDGDAA